MTSNSDEVCPKCRKVHDPSKCNAHSRSGQQCKKAPMEGQRVCKNHGGASPQAKAKAAERVTLRAVAATLVAHGVPMVDEHPLDGLLDEVRRAAGAVRVYAELISELTIPDPGAGPLDYLKGIGPDGELVWEDIKARLYGPDHNGEGAPHVLLNLWNAERQWHARVCKMALDAGVAERLVRAAESEGHQIAAIITGVLDHPELELTPTQRTAGRKVAADLIRAGHQEAIPATVI